MRNALFYMFLTTQNALFYKFRDIRMPYFTYFKVFRMPYFTKHFIFMANSDFLCNLAAQNVKHVGLWQK